MTFSTSDESGIELMKSLRAGRIVFFAGAGISKGSGLPDAMELIKPVARHYFPNRSDEDKENRRIVLEPEGVPNAERPLVFGKDILPEELYSILLKHALKQDKAQCVGMFGCLRPNKRLEYDPQPNFVHRFIVLYSYVHDVPVFTVNFDPMFEFACKEQDLPYCAYSFSDIEAYKRDCARDDGSRIVRICKVHGSVGLSDDESFNHHMIKTTAEAISKDDGWADMITKLMGDHDLAFAGYSGRDVDFYPAIRSAALEEKKTREAEESPGYGYRPLFWFNRFEDGQGNDAAAKADDCDACKVVGYPSEILPDCLQADAEIIPCTNEGLLAKRNKLVEQAQKPPAKNRAFEEKAPWRAVSEKYENALPSISEDVIYLETLVHWQRNLSARRFLQKHGKRLEDAVQREKGNLVWLQRQRVRVCREVGNMRGYTRGAWGLVRRTPKGDSRKEDFVHARLELISSLQMRIPNFDTSVVRYAPWEIALMVPLALVTEVAFWLLRYRIIGRGLLTEGNDVADISAVGELENRHLALEFRMVDALPVSEQRKERFRRPLEKRLLVLGDVAHKKGLRATVKGIVRRIDKIGLAKDTGNVADSADDAIKKGLAKDASADDVRKGLAGFYHKHKNAFYDVFKDVIQKANMDRRKGGLNEAISAYYDSRVSGNTLDDLKSLVTIVSRALGEGCASGLSENPLCLNELKKLIKDSDRCEGLNLLNRAHVKRFLRKVDKLRAH